MSGAENDSTWTFTDANEYELADIKYENGKEECDSSRAYCKILFGEYRINKKVFSEGIVRRFVEMINNNKAYKVVIQDVIEYPPKVSVRVVSTDEEFSPTEKDGGSYDIVNQIDSIIETKGQVQIIDEPTSNNRIAASCSTG